MRNLRQFAYIVCVMIASHATLAYAATVEDARAYVDTIAKDTLDALTKNRDVKQTKQQAIEEVFANRVDLKWVGKFVLGKYWRSASEDQRTRYLKEYEDFVLSHYSDRLAEYSGGSYKILDADNTREGRFAVNMQVITPEGTPVNVTYKLREGADGELKVYDLVIENISLITTQRAEFNSVVSREGLDYLINKMASKSLSVSNS